ncbi:hypothetical protein BDN72DRAFT_830894 [Pluteus cervinus]|uniref:Uncharacterized protein n=1 Tax=Pluteus cervinus TaxID=181527 RepID=A0ACD3BFH4_9AGAR|nr:hypothetical protein BDN72DRAFT_830894 [Pluteus cervinus]
MPIKRSSSSKRTLAEDTDDEHESKSQSQARRSTKKLKTDTTTDSLSASSQPTNKVLPVHIEFPARHAGALRLATWNICSYASSQKKGFKFYVEAEDPDILVLNETKLNDDPMNPSLKQRFPYIYWSHSSKKSYAGVAILSKIKPLSVDKTLPGHPHPDTVKGRVITLEFEKVYVIGTYVVNAGTDLKTLDAKNEWHVHFTKYIRELDKKKPVIWLGDMNVAPTEKDLSNAKKNWNKTPGYTEAETTAFRKILTGETESESDKSDTSAGKFIDVWRYLHPTDSHYTYFSYRFNCRLKGLGWRLDMFVISERLLNQVKMCEIRDEIYGASDHCPLVMEIESFQ